MIISHPAFSEPIELCENKNTVLALENKNFFRSFLLDLKNQINGESGEIVISENYEPINLKYICLISDFISIDLNEKSILNKVYSDLISISENDVSEETEEFKSNALNYFSALISQSEIELSFDDIDILNFLKSLKIRVDESDTFLEKIIDLIKIYTFMFGYKLIVFVNLKEFVSENELSEIYKYCNYNKINILLIESFQKNALPNEKLIIIDDDLCEIY